MIQIGSPHQLRSASVKRTNVVAIIQARLGSTRLPGKVLAPIGGMSMLARVCQRVGRAATLRRTVVATTLQPADRAIVEECNRLGMACFCGSEHDVLDRYCRAAAACSADAVVRITADCPLIDPDVIDQVVEAFLGARADYVANTLWRTWPRGLDTEVIASSALARTWREALEPHERCHVTPYLYQHPDSFRLLSVENQYGHCEGRWTVDLPEDLEFVRAVYQRLGDDGSFGWRDVWRLLAREPNLARINQHVRQKALAEG